MLSRIFATVGFAVSVTAGCVHAETDEPRDRASTLYNASRTAVNKLPEAPFVAFTLQDEGHLQGSVQEERLRVLMRESDGVAVVVPLRTPDGIDIAHPTPFVITGPSYGSFSYISRLGDFTLYDFGLRYTKPNRPGMFDAPGTPAPEATPLKTMATVRAYNPGYRPSDLGDTTLGDRPVHHLKLTPIRDPGHHVLREIWIDSATSLPARYLAEIPVTYPTDAGEVVEHDATIDTALLDGYLINLRVEGRYRILVGMVQEEGVVKWEVSQISFPSSEPDWVFDFKQWPQHLGERFPGLAP